MFVALLGYFFYNRVRFPFCSRFSLTFLLLTAFVGSFVLFARLFPRTSVYLFIRLFRCLFLRLDKISIGVSISVLLSNDERVGLVWRWRVRMGHPRCRRWGPDARKVSPRL